LRTFEAWDGFQNCDSFVRRFPGCCDGFWLVVQRFESRAAMERNASTGSTRILSFTSVTWFYVLILTKSEQKYLDGGVYRIEVSHSPLTLTNFSSINLVFVFRCSSSTTNPHLVRVRSRVRTSVEAKVCLGGAGSNPIFRISF
jgi:hypothetical protein